MTSLDCTITESVVAGVRQFIISGYVSEHAKFPAIKTNDPIVIKFSNVTGLNSVGTRAWVQWVQPLQSLSSITLEDAPSIFVKCFNRIVGSVTKNMRFQSFYVPFLSDTGERKDVLFLINRDFTPEGRVLTPGKLVDTTGKPLEIDVLDDYFSFLK